MRFHVENTPELSAPVVNLQEHLVAGTERILGKNLAGIYAHGSVAFGCFRWEISDFDFLIVVRDAPTDAKKRALMDFMLELDRFAPPKGLEISVVLLADCRNVVHPVPFQLHDSHMHRAWYERSPEDYIAKMNGTDPDLAAYFAVVRQTGKVLCGLPISEVFGEVPPEFVLDSFLRNVEDGGDDASAVLNRCRYEAYRQQGVLLSKVEGSEWGLEHLPQERHGAIRSALVDYAGNRLELVRPSEEHETAVMEYRAEHFANGETTLHGAALLETFEHYADWLKLVRGNLRRETVYPGWVLSDTMLALRKSDGKLVGIVDVRRELNDFLRNYGGHIGYGVRPGERRKGYATEMLRLALDHARSLGLSEVLIACNRDNAASRRTIENNAGKLLREFTQNDGKTVQMFSIALMKDYLAGRRG